MGDPVFDPAGRRRRRHVAPLVGAVAGIVAGLVVAGIVDLVEGGVTPVGYLGGALIGAVIGFVLALLVPAELDDGADDAHAARHEHDGLGGRADAPVEGASVKDVG
jgi:hypothetical protein